MSFFHKLGSSLRRQKPLAAGDDHQKAEKCLVDCLAAIAAYEDASLCSSARRLAALAAAPAVCMQTLLGACTRPSQISLLLSIAADSGTRAVPPVTLAIDRLLLQLADEKALSTVVDWWSGSGYAVSCRTETGLCVLHRCLVEALVRRWPDTARRVLDALKTNPAKPIALEVALKVAVDRLQALGAPTPVGWDDVVSVILDCADANYAVANLVQVFLHGAYEVVLKRLPFCVASQAGLFIEQIAESSEMPQTWPAVRCFDAALTLTGVKLTRTHFGSMLRAGNTALAIRAMQLGAVKFPHTACRAVLLTMSQKNTWNWLAELKKAYSEKILDVRCLSPGFRKEYCKHEPADVAGLAYDFDHDTNYTADMNYRGGSGRGDSYVGLALFWKLKVPPEARGLLTERVRLIAGVILRGLVAIGQPNVSVTFMTELIVGWI